MKNIADVIVVGGGLAGLAAAATVKAQGRSALVLDARTIGGRARTVERGGYTFNHGGHALYRGGAGTEVLKELGVRPVGSPPPLSNYRLMSADGTQSHLPVGPSTFLRTSAMGARSKAQLSTVLGLLSRIKAETHAHESVDEWLMSLGLREDGERVLRALIRLGSYADNFSTLSAEAAISQLKLGASSGVLYLDGGWSQLVDGLARNLAVRRAKVLSIEPDATGVEVHTDEAVHRASAVIIAAGTPELALSLLPADPRWGVDFGGPVTAACLDVGTRRIPSPGYVVGLDEPLYATTQSPPARQAPAGCAVVSVIRYGARSADEDRKDLDRFLAAAGVAEQDVQETRFLPRMVVTGAAPIAARGGYRGRPTIDATGCDRVLLAGDWVGPEGLMADAALASGKAAGLSAVRGLERSATMV